MRRGWAGRLIGHLALLALLAGALFAGAAVASASHSQTTAEWEWTRSVNP